MKILKALYHTLGMWGISRSKLTVSYDLSYFAVVILVTDVFLIIDFINHAVIKIRVVKTSYGDEEKVTCIFLGDWVYLTLSLT